MKNLGLLTRARCFSIGVLVLAWRRSLHRDAAISPPRLRLCRQRGSAVEKVGKTVKSSLPHAPSGNDGVLLGKVS